MLSIRYAQSHLSQYHIQALNGEYHHAKCRYAECHGSCIATLSIATPSINTFSKATPSISTLSKMSLRVRVFLCCMSLFSHYGVLLCWVSVGWISICCAPLGWMSWHCNHCERTILANCTDFTKILQNIAKYCKILQNIARYCKILQDIAKNCKILQNIARYCKILPKILNFFKIKVLKIEQTLILPLFPVRRPIL
jgi:hypothetical protein